MNEQVIVGLAAMVVATLLTGFAAFRNAVGYEYAHFLVLGELGAMIALTGLFPTGAANLGVTIFFSVSIAWTLFIWWRLRRDYLARNDPQRPV